MDTIAQHTTVRTLRAPWAPGLWLVFGRWTGPLPILSPLAVGSGLTEAAAQARCLGEVAENLSIGAGAHPLPVPAITANGAWLADDVRALPDAGAQGLGSEGCASHPDAALARSAAVLERIERAALALWGLGQLPARRLGLNAALTWAYRQHSDHRRSRAWQLDLVPGVVVVLVLTDDGAGGEMALGTAASLTRAVALDAALREAMQAEISWAAPAHHPDRPFAAHLHSALSHHMTALEAAPPAPEPPPPDGRTPEALLAASRQRHVLVDLTHPGLRIPVFRCLCPDWPRARGLWT